MLYNVPCYQNFSTLDYYKVSGAIEKYKKLYIVFIVQYTSEIFRFSKDLVILYVLSFENQTYCKLFILNFEYAS